MIIYASKHFITKLKCPVSLAKHKPTRVRTFDGWSADLLKVAKVQPVAVLMHDGSLGTVVVPLRGIWSFEEFVPVFLREVSQLLSAFGAVLDTKNQSMLVLRRTNRPLINALHDAKKLMEANVIEQMESGRPIDWNQAADFINQTPFSVIDDRTPAQTLVSLTSNQAG